MKKYDEFGIREKQYLAIADTAVHEFESLRDVRAALSNAFRCAADELESRDGEHGCPGSSLYWFIAKRAYVVEITLADSTRVLSHLHDKIAQMLDTTSGSMPVPLSLRRWQSANHEKFLSAYCRDLCVDTAKAMAFLNIPGFDPDSCGDNDRKTYEERSTRRWKQTVVSHIWNHSATSETIPLIKGEIATKDSAEAGTPAGYALIRSLYFYLEHPILFPLLFHELGHIHMELDQQEERQLKPTWGTTPRDTELFSFLRSSRKAASDLKIGMSRFGIYTIGDEDYQLIATEIWADALGVALGGASFVHALALQIFGQREHTNIAMGRRPFGGPNDGKYGDNRGHDVWHQQLKTLNASEIGEKPAQYFSFARILVAVKLALALYERAERAKDMGKDTEDIPFVDGLRDSCDAIEELWKRFRSSGDHTYHKDRSSGDHERWWDLYCDANESLAEGCFVHLEPHIGRMWQYAKDHNRHAYRFGRGPTDAKLRERIWQFFHSFMEEQPSCRDLHDKTVRQDLKEHAPTRLEDAALAMRWASATLLFNHATNLHRSIDEDDKVKFSELDKLVDETRWDGLGAFRYLLEWYQLVMAKGHSLSLDNLSGLAETNLLALFPKTELHNGISATEHLHSLMKSKFMIFFLNPRYEWWEKVDEFQGGSDRLAWIGSDAKKRELFEKYTSEFIEKLKNDLWTRGFDKIGENGRFPVSVLCLGVLRPSSYIDAADQVRPMTALNALTNLMKANVMGTTMECPLFPAIGDYSYVRLESGRTVSNLVSLAEDSFPSKMRSRIREPLETVPRHFEKPRMLVKIFGTNSLLEANGFGNGEFVRLALIKFQHRSKWLDLLNLLIGLQRQGADSNCELFLSSGWEDVVLLVRHNVMGQLSISDNKGNLYEQINAFLDVKANELDVQSMLITNMPPEDKPTNSAPQNSGNCHAPMAAPTGEPNLLATLCEEIKAHASKRLEERDPRKIIAKDWNVTAELTFGRYDARLRWTGVTPEEFQDIFLTLPADCYHKLQHLAHGAGWSIPLAHCSMSENEPFLFTRIDLTIH
ncbi:MAG: hypothetical protein A3H93_15480 [Rhodocyclales bacterium RIFCSPLOWO2_02_FULL_63_24]|nr:MAG: hypothetical protein A3H93_15480 [Rhodocyclales bacterium RIFCSPLOWO2_02_FULL_63_24]